jgi:hypothetical protein
MILVNIPLTETDGFEFKSGKTSDDALRSKVQAAASAFLNSGGGYFIVGIDNNGVVDGGISTSVGRQSREDWFDNLIHQVQPTPQYKIHKVESVGSRGTLTSGNALYAIEYPSSALAPHMSPDKRYYIRAGAHTVPANNFIVESLWAKRLVGKPRLVHAVRVRPDDREAIQFGVVSTNNDVALNVRVTVTPLMGTIQKTEKYWPLTAAIVDRANPMFFDYINFSRISANIDQETTIHIEYEDLSGNNYEYEEKFLIASSIGPLKIDQNKVVLALEKIAQALKGNK